MKLRVLAVATLLVGCGTASTARLASPLPPAWGGASAYDLATRSDGDIRDTLDAMVASRLRVLRVFLLDVEDPLGKWRDAPLARIDFILAEAQKRGVRVIVVLHDGPQRRDAYSRDYPGVAFYKEPLARASFRRRIEHALSYRGPSTGVAWSELGDVLYAWELQGECHWHHAPGWMEDMASYVKMLAPSHRVASGGLGTVQDSLLFTELLKGTPSVDVWTYRPSRSEPLEKAAAVLKGKGRPWMLVDFGGPREEPAATRRVLERAIAVATEHHVPWIFWSLGQDRRPQSHDLWPGDTVFDIVIPRATK